MKTKPVVTRHQADDDINQTFDHYLSEGGANLAVAFVDAYESATSHLSRFPLSGSLRLGHTLVISDLRQWPLQRFPYVILYFDREHSVEIWRVLHASVDIPAWLRGEE
ncbi:MAG: type II toxin-antitoxin system RelE/ParE family toxin [Pyrinomonadaceae bacterium]